MQVCIHSVSFEHMLCNEQGKILFNLYVVENRITSAGVVIYYHWEAMLISYLSTRFVLLPFTNIKELVENSDYRIGLNRGTTQEAYFMTSNDPFVQKAYSERIEPYLEEF